MNLATLVITLRTRLLFVLCSSRFGLVDWVIYGATYKLKPNIALIFLYIIIGFVPIIITIGKPSK